MKLASIEDCTGCGACASVCNKECIRMRIGENGFFYPWVNVDNCVECGLCTKNCHVLNTPKILLSEKAYYCGWDSSLSKRNESSSGGAFGALSEIVITQGGIVYGATFSNDKKTLFHSSTKDVSLNDLKKSKYLESDIGITIRYIRKDLKDGKLVLFCGTPCQIYGVRRVFGDRYDNLILCDFLCHGVPSQVRYQQYLKELEEQYSASVKDIGFRTKKYGWKTYCIVVDFNNGKQYVKLANEDPYYKHFFSNTNIRPSCYNCNRVTDSVADITLGDFWGARNIGIKDDDKGISLIICNTLRGKQMLCNLSSFELKKIEAVDVSYAFVKRYSTKKVTPLSQSFFRGFRMTLKDKLVCAALKNRMLRTIIYRMK